MIDFDFDETEVAQEEIRRLRAENYELRERLERAAGAGPAVGSHDRRSLFGAREASDPLGAWFPLVHTPLMAAGSQESYMLCLGPPSSQASDWVGPDAQFADQRREERPGAGAGGAGSDDNVFVQHMTRKRQEMLIAEIPETASSISTIVKTLATLLAGRFLEKNWGICSVGVGAWVGSMLLEELRKTANEAWARCSLFIVIGFPPPTSGLKAAPPGLSPRDEVVARSLRPVKPKLPCDPRLFNLASCGEFCTADTLRDWFKLGPSAETSVGTQISSVPGNQDLLRNQLHRTHAFWTITKLGVGINPLENTSIAREYREACIRDGFARCGRSLFEADNESLQELLSLPHMKAIQKHMPSGREPHALVECFVVGECGAENGVELRSFADMSTQGQLETNGGKGCKTVSFVRFGMRASASNNAFDGASIHGGAIGAAMDESTAECMKFWLQPTVSTRKISHQFMKMIVPYATYRIDCAIEAIKNDGLLVEVKGIMCDAMNERCCITTAEMIDLPKFGHHDNSWW